MVSERMLGLGTSRSVIRELFEYGKQRAAVVGKENVFDFSIGNPSVPAPPEVNQIAIRLLQEENSTILHGYTSAQGDPGVRKAIADNLNSRYGTCYTGTELYMTVGASAALCCCFNALTTPGGSEYIVFAPYFPEYKVFIEGAGGTMKVVQPHPDTLQLDAQALAEAITPQTKGVVINSPNNPSGVIYTEETLKAVAAVLEEKSIQYGHPIFLISDEPYREIAFQGYTVPWLPSFYPNTLVTYSFSKSLSLPGERIGYVLVPQSVTEHEKVYAAIAGAGRSLGYVNAPSLFQRVAAECCGMTSDISIYENNAKLLVTSLREMGYECVQPQGAFYLFLKALEPDDKAFSQKAREFDLLLVPGSGFGAPGWLRLAFCVQPDMIRRAMPKFRELAAAYKA